MCGSTTTTSNVPQQSAQQAGLWNAATGTPSASGPTPPMPPIPGMTPQIWAQMNAGRNPATQVNGPPLPTSAPVYGQPTVAGLTPDQYASYGAVQNAMGQAQPGLLASSNFATQAANYQPGQVGGGNLGPAAQTAAPNPVQAQQNAAALSGGAGMVNASGLRVGAPSVGAQNIGTSTLPQTDLQGYMNPFTNQVINTTNAQIERARQTAQGQTSAQALTQGAYGGSRSGVMGALTNQAYDQNTLASDASLNQANYSQATQNAQIDLARRLQADQANQGANLQAGIASGQLGVQAGGINAQTGLAAGITNANLAQGNNIFNAGAFNQNSQFGASLAANTGLANNQLGATVGMANTGAANQQAQFGAGLLQRAQEANQGAGLAANQQRLGGAGLLANDALSGQTAALQGATALNQAGTQQQTTNQNALSSAFQQWQQQQNYPFQYYNFLNGLATPGSNTTTQTREQSPLGTIAGLATTAAGLIFPPAAIGAGLLNRANAATNMTPQMTTTPGSY